MTAELTYLVIICLEYIFMMDRKKISSGDMESNIFYFNN